MNEKIRAICENAVAGKCSAESFYDSLRAAADDTRTDDDLACLLEDALMELEMEHDGCGSKKAMQKMIKETAEYILGEMK